MPIIVSIVEDYTPVRQIMAERIGQAPGMTLGLSSTMVRRGRFLGLCAAVAGAMLLPAVSRGAAQTDPNVVLIFADDLGYGDLGCYGATQVKTPNIDSLAKEGRMFSDAHSVSAVCTPSRYSLLTGEYAWRKGYWAPIWFDHGLIIDEKQTTVASVFQKKGYATACIGKWHLGFGEKTPNWNGELKPGPLEVGFDHYFGIPVVSSHPPFVFVEDHRVLGLDPADPFVFGPAAEKNQYAQKFPDKRVGRDVGGAKAAHALYDDEQNGITLATRAADWIRKQQDKPFFLYLAPGHVHHPYTPNKRFKGTSECGLYGDFIHELDWMIGEVLRALEETGAAKNTLVIFTSDNGGSMNPISCRDAWKAGHRINGDLLGFKFGAWEGGHRVPYIVRWPGHVPAGSHSSQLISHVDILATMAALVNVEMPPGAGPDSINVLPALTGDPAKPLRESVVLAPLASANLALRSGPWVFISGQGSGGYDNGVAELALTHEVNSDVTADGKIKQDAPKEQLYNLEKDPRQAVNVIRFYPEIANEMRKQLDKIAADRKDTRPNCGRR
jgi:arylsulfatase A-like enzyme